MWQALRQTLQDPDEPGLLARQQQGVLALADWLRALLDEGLVHAQYLFTNLWHNQITQLLEHALPGLAAALEEIEALRHGDASAVEQLLAALGELYLLTQTFCQCQYLPAPQQADVRLRAGMSLLAPEPVFARQPAVPDTWLLLAQRTGEHVRNSSWYYHRAWLWGPTTGRYALLQTWGSRAPKPPTTLQLGKQLQGSLSYYPSAYPLRALLRPDATWLTPRSPARPPGLSPRQLPQDYAKALAQQPWLLEWPVTVKDVLVVFTGPDKLQLYHPGEHVLLPLRGEPHEAWQLLATSGGEPLTVFGEWNGHALLPLPAGPRPFPLLPLRPHDPAHLLEATVRNSPGRDPAQLRAAAARALGACTRGYDDHPRAPSAHSGGPAGPPAPDQLAAGARHGPRPRRRAARNATGSGV